MEKLRLSVYFVIGIIIILIVFTLLKSWFVYDRGIELAKHPSNSIQTVYVEPDDDLVEHSAVVWGKFLYYPLGLNRDRENFGPRKALNHAQNLVFVDLQTGRNRKVFNKSVYIWDYFYGAEPEKLSSDSETQEVSEDVFPSLKTGKKFVIVGMPEDTNKDGYLNQKDSKKVFVYDPNYDELLPVLPKKFYLEKILPDTPENKLVMIVKREEESGPGKKKPNLPTLYIYDTLQKRGQMIERP